MFAPVRSHTAFEETVDRLGTAISLGLLAPGSRLPAERELCARLGISRSTLRQALTALTQSGHVFATRGRGGGTFVSDPLPPADPPSPRCSRAGGRPATSGWRSSWAWRCWPPSAPSRRRWRTRAARAALDGMLEDFSAYRQTDVRLHVCLAQATGSPPLVRAMTEAQGAMTDLLAHIAHPPEVLASSNAQHRRLLRRSASATAARAVEVMAQHLQGTEHVLAGLLPRGRGRPTVRTNAAISALDFSRVELFVTIEGRVSKPFRLKGRGR